MCFFCLFSQVLVLHPETRTRALTWPSLKTGAEMHAILYRILDSICAPEICCFSLALINQAVCLGSTTSTAGEEKTEEYGTKEVIEDAKRLSATLTRS